MSYMGKESELLADRVSVNAYGAGGIFDDNCFELCATDEEKHERFRILIHRDDVEKLIRDMTEVYQKYIVRHHNNADAPCDFNCSIMDIRTTIKMQNGML